MPSATLKNTDTDTSVPVPGAFDIGCGKGDRVGSELRGSFLSRMHGTASRAEEEWNAAQVLRLIEKPLSETRRYIRSGFWIEEIPFTTRLTGLTQKALAERIGLSPRTLQRMLKERTRLSPEESDRLYRIQKVGSAALALFKGDLAAMQRWLKTPLPALSGESPLAYSDTEPGAQLVLDLIDRLEHGVFS